MKMEHFFFEMKMDKQDIKTVSLFHGSPTAIDGDFLEPHPSTVLDGESVVFATDKTSVALVFMVPWRDQELGFGSYDGSDMFLEENSPGAFANAFSNKGGWLYMVDGKGFVDDPRLGMRNREFVCKDKVRIQSRFFVPDIANAIELIGMSVIKFEQRMELYRKAGLLKMPTKKES